MKTLLLASTALVATAGFAAAEISISGWAEIGIIGGDLFVDSDETDQFHTDIDVNFSMTGETDGGIAFGAQVDLDENGAFNNRTQGGETYFISYGGMRLDMGDTDGAFDAAMQEVNVIGGSINDDETLHAGFSGNGGTDLRNIGGLGDDPQLGAGLDGLYDGQIARASYAFEGFSVFGSAEIDDNGGGDPVWGIGGRYAADIAGFEFGIGLGYQTANDVADVWGISLDGEIMGIAAAVNYSETDFDDAGLLVHWGIGAGYEWNALSVAANYGEYDLKSSGVDSSGWGVIANYDLGGGLVAMAGYGSSDISSDFADGLGSSDKSFDRYSVGLSMSF